MSDIKEKDQEKQTIHLTKEYLEDVFSTTTKEVLKDVLAEVKKDLSEHVKNELVNQWVSGAKEQLENLTIFKAAPDEPDNIGLIENGFSIDEVRKILDRD